MCWFDSERSSKSQILQDVLTALTLLPQNQHLHSMEAATSNAEEARKCHLKKYKAKK